MAHLLKLNNANMDDEDQPMIRRNSRSIGCMRIDKVVGKGTFGEVYKAKDKRNSDEVALKKIITTRETQGFPVTAIREIKILNLMHHENIVNLREILTFDDSENDKSEPSVADKGFCIGDVFMVFDFAEYDLSGLLKASGLAWTAQLRKCYMYQLISGVQYLHSKKILHRDLKSANILVTRNNILKIADWGLARIIPSQKDQRLTSPVVTLWYRSPELVLGSRYYSTEIDMWSVGCIMGEMVTRSAILKGEKEAEQLKLIFQLTGTPTGSVLEKYTKLPDWDKLNMEEVTTGAGGCTSEGSSGAIMRAPFVSDTTKFQTKFSMMSQSGCALLARCLDLNPETRISADDALSHVFFHGIDSDDSEAVVPPSALPRLSVEPVTEYLDQERRKRVLEAQRAAAEKKAATLRAAEEAMKAEANRQRIKQNAERVRNTGKRSGIVGKYQVVARIDPSKLGAVGGAGAAGGPVAIKGDMNRMSSNALRVPERVQGAATGSTGHPLEAGTGGPGPGPGPPTSTGAGGSMGHWAPPEPDLEQAAKRSRLDPGGRSGAP